MRLLPSDHDVMEVTAERLRIGGRTSVNLRLAGLLPYVVLKEYAAFMDVTGRPEATARLRNEAAAVVTTAIGAFRQG